MATAAVKAQGTLLQIGDGVTPTETFTTIAECTTIDWTGDSDELDVSSHSSLNAWREWIQGMKSAEISFELNWAPNNAQHSEAARGLLGLFLSGLVVNLQIVYPGTALTVNFAGFVRNFSPTAPTDGVLGATGTIRVTGNVTFT